VDDGFEEAVAGDWRDRRVDGDESGAGFQGSALQRKGLVKFRARSVSV
jgi:hypothetical protein